MGFRGNGMTGLRPCPFCGNDGELFHDTAHDVVIAFCGWCGANIREVNEDKAIKAWNRRVSEAEEKEI